MYRQNGDSTGDLGLSQLLVFAFICSFLSLFIFGHLFYLHYLFYAISTVILFNFSYLTCIHVIYLFIQTLHGEPIKALDPSSPFLRLEKKDSGGKCDLCPLMLIWTFAWIVTHPMQLVLWSFSPLLMLYKVKRPITSRVIRAI